MRPLFRTSQWNTIKSLARSKVGTPRCGVRSAQRADPTNYEICFTNASDLRQPRDVRKSVAICVLVVAALSWVSAQDQERKLVDRLLKPDMTLQNEAQNKKFIGDRTSSMHKHANVGTFYVQKKSNSKTFSATGDFSTRQFFSQPFHSKHNKFETSSPQGVANSRSAYANQSAGGARDASQSGKKVPVRPYAENQPFLDEGKSQKSLNRQNAPLTIEQVRELLNKNK